MYSGTDHYSLFFDNIKNLSLSLDQTPAYHMDGAGGFLTAYKINDLSGKVEKKSCPDTRKAKGMEIYQFSTDRIIPISDDEFVFEAYKKKKEDVMFKVKLHYLIQVLFLDF